MAIENCQLCRGTGWKMVARPDGAGTMAATRATSRRSAFQHVAGEVRILGLRP